MVLLQTVHTESLVLLTFFINVGPIPEPEAFLQGMRAIAKQADRWTWKFRTVWHLRPCTLSLSGFGCNSLSLITIGSLCGESRNLHCLIMGRPPPDRFWILFSMRLSPYQLAKRSISNNCTSFYKLSRVGELWVNSTSINPLNSSVHFAWRWEGRRITTLLSVSIELMSAW